MPITPLPQFEADLAEHLAEQADREAYERLNAPKTIVVRFGTMKLVGEFPYRGDAKPGCGSKIVVRTHRGTEIGEMLTSTCPNSGCSKSVSRKEMLEYIDNSGGRQYPFFSKGRALRVATKEDLDAQARLEQGAHGIKMEARRIAEALGAPLKIVDAEPILGEERLTIYYTADDRPDVNDLRQRLETRFDNRIDLRQVGARDEARLTADYERCGQYCCCKNFLKVLKPVSMKSAKTQRQTLDPLKISGRCGRLMCCLRYEDETYEELRKRLPRRGSRVGTPDGDGEVVDAQILTQLALVRLDADGKQVAVPVEELTKPGAARKAEPAEPRSRDGDRRARGSRRDEQAGDERPRRKRRRKPDAEPSGDAATGTAAPGLDDLPGDSLPGTATDSASDTGDRPKKKKKRRRRRKPTDGAPAGEIGPPNIAGDSDGATDAPASSDPDTDDAPAKKKGKKKRRRRRKRPPGEGPANDGGNAPPPPPPSPAE